MKELTESLIDSMQLAGKGKTHSYDTEAVVRRIEDDTAWVHIPGGVDETPVKLTINAKVGDLVQVRVGDGRAWITGNASAPPTDDAAANVAKKTAVQAQGAATEAQETATEAITQAISAAEAATSARQSAQDASTAATEATEAAGVANTSANSALTQLGTVEDVLGTLNWIAEHAVYYPTSDPEAIDGKNYFSVVATAVTSPSDDDISSYYEEASGKYYPTTDTTIDTTKTYYTLTATPVAVPAGGDPEALGYYQVASIDEAVSNYIATHLALTDDGLYILMDESGYKLKLTNDGAFIVDPSGATVATYSAQTVLGNLNGLNYLTLSHNGLSLTVDGGATNIFDVRLAGSSSSYTKSFSQTYSQYGSYGNLGLNRNMSDGTLALVINMRNSLDSGNVYTETYNFTVGTPSTVSAFKYEDATYGHQEITIQFTGADIILIDAYNQPNATLSLWGTATFPVTTNRTTYMTFGTRASSAVNGQYSVAEGYGVEASGAYSHAQNYNTVAAYDDQTALGKFNDNQSNTAVEIGNGTSNAARSNALTVDWYGNVETAGGIETGDEAIIAEGLSVYEVGQGNFFVVRPDQNKVLLAVDDTAAAGTTDGDLYAAITALGWESEVIV